MMADKFENIADYEVGQHVDQSKGYGYGLYDPDGRFVEEIFGFDSMEAAADAAHDAIKHYGWLDPYTDI